MPASRRSQTAATDALVAIAPPLTRWIERLLAGHDPSLTLAQYLALRAIANDELPSSEIARRTGVSGPAVSQLLSALGDAGLIERTPVPGDRRRQALSASPAGSRALRSAETLLRRRLGSLLADVAPHEAEALRLGLDAVAAALEGRPPPRRPPPQPPDPRRPGPRPRPTSPAARRR